MTAAARTAPDNRLPKDECIRIAAQLETGWITGSRYRHDLSHEQILRFAARGVFSVSPQYRQDVLRRKAKHLHDLGLLYGGPGKRFGDGVGYQATPAGMAVLGLLEKRRKGHRND